MSPAAVVTGDGHIFSQKLDGETSEDIRGAWGNGIPTASGRVWLMTVRGSKNYSVKSISQFLSDKIGMPIEMARALIEAAVNKTEGFAIECETVFEKPKDESWREAYRLRRHYENFRIR